MCFAMLLFCVSLLNLMYTSLGIGLDDCTQGRRAHLDISIAVKYKDKKDWTVIKCQSSVLEEGSAFDCIAKDIIARKPL